MERHSELAIQNSVDSGRQNKTDSATKFASPPEEPVFWKFPTNLRKKLLRKPIDP